MTLLHNIAFTMPRALCQASSHIHAPMHDVNTSFEEICFVDLSNQIKSMYHVNLYNDVISSTACKLMEI